MRRLPILDQIRIAGHCSEAWEGMAGDGRTRMCASCQLPVHNLTAMTRAEAEALIASHQGRLCARYYRRSDGTIATTDEDSPRRRARWLAALAGLAGIAGLLTQVRAYQRLRADPATSPAALVDPAEPEPAAEVHEEHAEREPAPPPAAEPSRAERVTEVLEESSHWKQGVVDLHADGVLDDLTK